MALSTSQAPKPPSGRDALRARLALLQGKLRTALSDKTARMQHIVALCRAERRAMREELKRKRASSLQQIEYEIEAARASARHLRLSRLVEARKSADSDIAAARAAIAVERAHQDELRRIGHEHRRRRAEVHRLHELAAKSGELHTALLGPFAPLVQRVGSKVKPVPGESRAEAILRYAQTHPSEAHAAAEPRIEREIEETRQEITKTKAALRSAPRTPKRSERRSAPRAPAPAVPAARKAPAFAALRPLGPPPAKPAREKNAEPPTPRRPGQVPRGGGGMPLEELLRERDMLARKEPKAKASRPSKAPAAKRAPSAKTPKKRRQEEEMPARSSPPPPPSSTRLSPASVPPPRPPANQVTRARTPETVKAPEVRDTAAVAKLIRQDIQAAVSSGQLPRAKYSVTTEKYSMGSSITVVASKLPFPVLNPKAFRLTPFGPDFDREHFASRNTPEAESLQRALEDIVGAYHWDLSDSQSDSYNARFHRDIRLDDQGEMDRIRETLTKAQKKGAPAGART
jgi:hypothetical protein